MNCSWTKCPGTFTCCVKVLKWMPWIQINLQICTLILNSATVMVVLLPMLSLWDSKKAMLQTLPVCSAVISFSLQSDYSIVPPLLQCELPDHVRFLPAPAYVQPIVRAFPLLPHTAPLLPAAAPAVLFSLPMPMTRQNKTYWTFIAPCTCKS